MQGQGMIMVMLFPGSILFLPYASLCLIAFCELTTSVVTAA